MSDDQLAEALVNECKHQILHAMISVMEKLGGRAVLDRRLTANSMVVKYVMLGYEQITETIGEGSGALVLTEVESEGLGRVAHCVSLLKAISQPET